MEMELFHLISDKGKGGIQLDIAGFQQSGDNRFSQSLISKLIELVPCILLGIILFFLIALRRSFRNLLAGYQSNRHENTSSI